METSAFLTLVHCHAAHDDTWPMFVVDLRNSCEGLLYQQGSRLPFFMAGYGLLDEEQLIENERQQIILDKIIYMQSSSSRMLREGVGLNARFYSRTKRRNPGTAHPLGKIIFLKPLKAIVRTYVL